MGPRTIAIPTKSISTMVAVDNATHMASTFPSPSVSLSSSHSSTPSTPLLGPNSNEPISFESAPAAHRAPAISSPTATTPAFVWGDLDADSFSQAIHAAYAEWKRNLFPVPFGSSGKRFVKEMSCLFRVFAESSAGMGQALRCLCLKRFLRCAD